MKRMGVKTFEREFDDLYFAEDEDVEFPTDSGKIELYSTYFEQMQDLIRCQYICLTRNRLKDFTG